MTGFVREAREADALAITQVQIASWQHAYAGIFTADQLASMSTPEVVAAWEGRWRDLITNPPTSRHRVMVAITGGTRDAVGFAFAGPANDEDRWPQTDGQLYELRVLPDQTGQGHGSRLLHAVASTLADDGFQTATTWVSSADKALRQFLESSGWAPDGARAELDFDYTTVQTMRLHTRVAE